MTADITVIAHLYGNTHNHFIADWAQAIENLNHTPARVIVATDPDNPADVYHLPYDIIHVPLARYKVRDGLNTVINQCTTQWVTFCDIDDILFPDAFKHLNDADGYDACANSIQFRSNGAILTSRPERFHSEPWANHVMVNAYFTKEIFDRVRGIPPIMFIDWGLWWKLHKHNARWFPSPGVQMLYNDIPAEHRFSNNIPDNALQEAHDFIRTYDPRNPKD